MRKVHLYLHKPNWHTVGIHLEHLMHDPRFWAGAALVIVAGLMILTAMLSQSAGTITPGPGMPMAPYGLLY